MPDDRHYKREMHALACQSMNDYDKTIYLSIAMTVPNAVLKTIVGSTRIIVVCRTCGMMVTKTCGHDCIASYVECKIYFYKIYVIGMTGAIYSNKFWGHNSSASNVPNSYASNVADPHSRQSVLIAEG